MRNINSYEQKEIIGRKKMDSLINKLFRNYKIRVIYTLDKFAHYDIRIDFLDENDTIYKIIIGEIKVRDNYKNSEELMLELYKYNKLIQEANKVKNNEDVEDVKTWYINFIDDEAVVFSFRKEDNHKIHKIPCRKNNISYEKVIKDIIFLHKNTAKIIKY